MTVVAESEDTAERKLSEWLLRRGRHPTGRKEVTSVAQVQLQSGQRYDASIRRQGLGLAISNALVELQGGKIWVESAKGQGAAFFVELPVNGQAAAPHGHA